MGILVNELKALEGFCKCTSPLITGKQLCWSEGIIGALNQEQIEKYCKKKIVKESQFPSIQAIFAEASRACRIGNIVDNVKIENAKVRLDCISEYIRKRKAGLPVSVSLGV